MNGKQENCARKQRLVVLLVSAITLFGAYARWLPMQDPLWLDELHTSWVVSGQLSEVAPRAAMGNQSPVYFYGVWGITQLFGQSALTLRLISLVAGVLLIPAAFLVARDWTESAIAGVVAAALVAIEWQFLFYSSEARPYALAQMVGLVQVAFFARTHILWHPGDNRTRRRLIASLTFIASSVFLFYLHYTTALLFVAEAVAFLALLWLGTSDFKEGWRTRLINLAIDSAIAAICCLPAVPALFAIADRRQQWDSLRIELPMEDVWRALAICIALPALLAAVAAVARLALKKRSVAKLPNPGTVVLSVAWLLVPAALIYCARGIGWANLIHLRYIIASAVAPMILAAVFCSSAVGRRTQSAVASLVILAALLNAPWLAALVHGERTVAFRNEDWKAMAKLINSSEASWRQPVFVCSGLVEDARLADSQDPEFHEYCLFAVRGIYPLDRSGQQLHAIPTNRQSRFTADHLQQIETTGGAWLVVRGSVQFADAVEVDLMSSISSCGLTPRLHSRHSFGGLTAIWIGVD